MKNKNQEHKHSWVIPEGSDNNDVIVCEKCGIDYDKWVEKMEAKGYTLKQMERFEEQ